MIDDVERWSHFECYRIWIFWLWFCSIINWFRFDPFTIQSLWFEDYTIPLDFSNFIISKIEVFPFWIKPFNNLNQVFFFIRLDYYLMTDCLTVRTAARGGTGAAQHVQADAGKGAAVCGNQTQRSGPRLQPFGGHRTGQRRETSPRIATKVQSNGQSIGPFYLRESTTGSFIFAFFFFFFLKMIDECCYWFLLELGKVNSGKVRLHFYDDIIYLSDWCKFQSVLEWVRLTNIILLWSYSVTFIQ